MIFEVANAITTVGPSGTGVFEDIHEGGDLILLVISLFVLVSFILSIIFILYGGLLLILSGGKEEKIKPAINTIRYSILGIIITIASIFIFPLFGRLLGLDVQEYAKPDMILEKISSLGDMITGNTGTKSYDIDMGDDTNIDNVDFNRLD